MKVKLDFMVVLAEWPLLLSGIGWIMALTIAAVIAGVSLSIACAWIRAQGFGDTLAPTWLKALVCAYVELIWNTPFIVQLFFSFFGLPSVGIKLSVEAAVSLAMNRLQIFFRVVLPPAFKKIWPSLVSQIIIVMLGSSVCGQISTPELSLAADLIHSRNFRSFETFIIVGAIF